MGTKDRGGGLTHNQAIHDVYKVNLPASPPHCLPKVCPLRCAPFKVCPLRCAPFEVCDIFCTVHVHASCATHTHTHTHTHTQIHRQTHHNTHGIVQLLATIFGLITSATTSLDHTHLLAALPCEVSLPLWPRSTRCSCVLCICCPPYYIWKTNNIN